MKSAFKSLYGFAAIAMLLLATMPVIFAGLPPSVPPSDDIAMWIQPTTISLSTANPSHTIGYRFNVTVWAKANVSTAGWQFWMRYNPAVLNATGCWYCRPDGTGSSTEKSEYFGEIPHYSQPPAFNPGQVEFGESYAGTYVPPRLNGLRLALVEFEVIAIPDKYETLTSDIEISSAVYESQTYMLDEEIKPIPSPPFMAYDALYSFVWASPPSPGLEVSPSKDFFERYSIWNGTTFDATVRLTDLSAAWGLTNVSFTLSFNSTELELMNIVGNAADWNLALNVVNSTAGVVDVYAETSKTLSGDVDIITLTFMILDQEMYLEVEQETHDLNLTDVLAYDHVTQIPVNPIISAKIIVEGFLELAMPWMEVKPKDTVLGPNFVKHTTFKVNVTINRLHFAWKLVALEFRLSYNKTLIKPVEIKEGPYLPAYAPYGTWPMSYIEEDSPYGVSNILFGDLILPNPENGTWLPPFPGAELGQPGENGTIAIITFEVLEQLPGYGPGAMDLTCALDLFGIFMINTDLEYILVNTDLVVNGTLTIHGYNEQQRCIDVYGGADNAGYGSIPFPAPYGGQGLNQPMDLVIPQSEVTLFGKVTYNYWPVQQKDVNFEVEGPYDHENGEYIPRNNKFVLLKETARTDADGVANISFAMPWPCENPESLLGVWKVTATVNIRDVVVNDTLYFYYDYMAHILKVTTNSTYYAHCETVEITVEYGSHAMQKYNGTFVAVIKDELNVVIGMALAEDVTLGGADFCTFKDDKVKLYIHIEKWAFVGYADIYVNCYDKDPTDGGFAWTKQAFEDDIIYILPN